MAMEIAQVYAKILPLVGQKEKFDKYDGIACLQRIEYCARISHESTEAMTDTSYDKFIRSVVLNHGDWSVTEHVSLSIEIQTDRGVTHEIVRHRLFGFTQSSTRFINYTKKHKAEFVYPVIEHEYYDQDWVDAINFAEEKYKKLIAKGWKPELARSVFPTALATRIVVSGNLRNWRHFFLMRTTKNTHPQFRQFSIPLLEEFKSKIPILYEDIEPLASQKENLEKGR